MDVAGLQKLLAKKNQIIKDLDLQNQEIRDNNAKLIKALDDIAVRQKKGLACAKEIRARLDKDKVRLQ